jgi:trigger factor
MQTVIDNSNPTITKLKITADKALLDSTKQAVLKRMSGQIKVAGFRSGHAPMQLVEKQIDSTLLQNEFLDQIVNKMYVEAITEHNLRPVNRPTVSINKFVPFTDLEIEAEVETVGAIELPDYRLIKLAPKSVSVTAKDVDEVISSIALRSAEKKEVERAAKLSDEVWIDFSGKDSKTKEPINGTDGKEYPLVLGSNTFIPGFEPNLIGLKKGDTKEFDVTFPADYGVAALQKRKVTFSVKVVKVQEVVAPEFNDDFATQVSPFKSLKELKDDIKRQLTQDRQQQNDRDYESELLTKIAEKAKVVVPPILIEEELDRQEEDERQNLVYRGQTWEEHLKAEGINAKQHRDKNRQAAEARVKAGLVLSEISEKENISVSSIELKNYIDSLKGQYKDSAMQAELDNPENQRELRNRLITSKTLQKLIAYAQAK